MAIYKLEFDSNMYIDDETGEVFENEFEAIEMEHRQKALNAALWVKNLQYEVDNLDKEIKAFKKRKEAKERTIESLKSQLIKLTGGEGFEETNVKVSFKESEAVVIEDENLLDNKYFKVTVSRKPIKADIKKAIKNGDVIYGAKLEKRNNCTVK